MICKPTICDKFIGKARCCFGSITDALYANVSDFPHICRPDKIDLSSGQDGVGSRLLIDTVYQG